MVIRMLNSSYALLKGCAGRQYSADEKEHRIARIAKITIEELQPASKMIQITNSAILAIPQAACDPSGSLI